MYSDEDMADAIDRIILAKPDVTEMQINELITVGCVLAQAHGYPDSCWLDIPLAVINTFSFSQFPNDYQPLALIDNKVTSQDI